MRGKLSLKRSTDPVIIQCVNRRQESRSEKFEEDCDNNGYEVEAAVELSSPNPCFVTIQTEDGNLHRLPVSLDDNQFTVHPRCSPQYDKLPVTSRNSITKLQDAFKPPQSSLAKNANKLDTVSSSGNVCKTYPVHKKLLDNRQESLIDDIRANCKEQGLTPSALLRRYDIIMKPPKRMVAKGGRCNVTIINVPARNRHFMKDVFTTAVDMPWRYAILIFSASFLMSWLGFASVWYFISWLHGDFDHQNVEFGQKTNTILIQPCVSGLKNFVSCFLFSVETQHTIGYGTRSITEECPVAIFVMCLQSIIGILISSCMVGIVFAKLSRPKLRSNTVMFSKNSIITLRNGRLVLLFRLINLRRSHLIVSQIKVQIVHRVDVSSEGATQCFIQQELSVGSLLNDNEITSLLICPITVCHIIDENSPIYELSPKQILSAKFEMIVALEGIVEPTGNSVQIRTSYLPREIMWGYRFESMMSYNEKLGTYNVDCSRLNNLVEDSTPHESASSLFRNKKTL